jgi:hypothetical protein
MFCPANPSTLDNRYLKSNRGAALANVDLGYKDYLFLNLTGRSEGSSVLPKTIIYSNTIVVVFHSSLHLLLKI